MDEFEYDLYEDTLSKNDLQNLFNITYKTKIKDNATGRTSPFYDEVEQKLNQLLESYKNTVDNITKPEEYATSPSDSLFGTSNPFHNSKSSKLDQLTDITFPSSPQMIPSYLDYSFSPIKLNVDPLKTVDSSKFPASSLLAYPTSSLYDHQIPSMNEPNFKLSRKTGLEGSDDINKLISDSPTFNYKELFPSTFDDQVLYENALSVLPSQEPSDHLQIDQSLTFTKIMNTGISSQLSKQISFLLLELDKLRELNMKLTNELRSRESEINLTKNELVLVKSRTKPLQDGGSLTGLVEDIYRAQKTRDAAIMDRLKEANQERNTAVMRSSLIHQRIAQGKNDIIASLMRSHSLDDLRASTDKFIEVVTAERERKRIANEQEVETILFERDLMHKQKNDLEKKQSLLVGKLEQEVQTRKDLQKKLIGTEKEKNDYLNKMNFLQNRLKSLKVCESLYQSLSKEEELRNQCSQKMVRINSELQNKNKQLEKLAQEREELKVKVEQTSTDNKFLIDKCNSLELILKEERDQSERLNRLVGVLRRKLAETGSTVGF